MGRKTKIFLVIITNFPFKKKKNSRYRFFCNHIHLYVLVVFYATTKKLIEINETL